MGLMEGPPPASSVSASCTEGAMIIVCESHLATAFGAATVSKLRAVVEECISKRETVATVFLFVAGGACTGMPLPIWARTKGAGAAVAEDEAQALLNTCLAEFAWLPQPLVGLADGQICTIGSALLESCDLVMATGATEFQVKMDHGLRTVGADEAQEIGIISQTVDTEAQLFEECDNIRKQLINYTPQARYAIKEMFPPATQRFRELLEQHPPRKDRPPKPLAAQHPMGANDFKESQPAPAPPKPAPKDAGEGVNPAKSNYNGRIQRKHELIAESCTRHGPITSLMICNIPCRITQEELVRVMDALGFYGTFDFVYLPTAARSASSTISNLGYGFVNFVDHGSAALFSQRFQNYQFKGTGSTKECKVMPAFIQGLLRNVQNFSTTAARHKSPGPFVRLADGRAPGEEELQALALLKACAEEDPSDHTD